jgi:hypothetical protein
MFSRKQGVGVRTSRQILGTPIPNVHVAAHLGCMRGLSLLLGRGGCSACPHGGEVVQQEGSPPLEQEGQQVRGLDVRVNPHLHASRCQ